MEMHSEILKPMAVLAAWTMFMWLWMYVTRIPAMSKAGVDTGSLTGGTGKDLDGVIPDNIQWKAHNYNHLHEAPTVFYAVALALASLVQATVNKVMIRFLLFALSSFVLIMLVAHTVMAAFAH